MAVSITDRTNAPSIKPFQHICVTSATEAGAGGSHTATYGSTRSLACNLHVRHQAASVADVRVPLCTQTSHTDPFKERFEALLMRLRPGRGPSEVAYMRDVHVRRVPHACCHVLYRGRRGTYCWAFEDARFEIERNIRTGADVRHVPPSQPLFLSHPVPHRDTHARSWAFQRDMDRCVFPCYHGYNSGGGGGTYRTVLDNL